MTVSATARLALPLLEAGQAAKEIAHNEALARADLLVNPVAEAIGLDTPPAAPAPGQAWIVGQAPVGAWAGHAGELAGWTAGGWRFAAPFEGQHVWLRGAGHWAVRGPAGWSQGVVAASEVRVGGVKVIGARQGAVAGPAGGTVVDAEARAALSAILTVLRHHGLIAT